MNNVNAYLIPDQLEEGEARSERPDRPAAAARKGERRGRNMPEGPGKGAVVDEASARRARLLLRVAAVFFLLFCLNVLLGKAQVIFAVSFGLLLPDVAEFLLLLFSALFFTLAALSREKALGKRAGNGSR